MTEHQPGDLWIGVTTPTMNQIQMKYFEQFAVPMDDRNPSIGKVETRMNLSAFVRDAIAETMKGNS